jgi:hypothetical protein
MQQSVVHISWLVLGRWQYFFGITPVSSRIFLDLPGFSAVFFWIYLILVPYFFGFE